MNYLLKLFKFALVGSTGMVLDFGSTWLLRDKLKLNQYISNAIGFIIAVINNYILNKYFTFQEHGNISLNQLSKFATISIIGLSLNTLFLYILHKFFKIKFYWAKLIATGFVFLWNFMINSLLTFN